jgi:hypothetical protein
MLTVAIGLSDDIGQTSVIKDKHARRPASNLPGCRDGNCIRSGSGR